MGEKESPVPKGNSLHAKSLKSCILRKAFKSITASLQARHASLLFTIQSSDAKMPRADPKQKGITTCTEKIKVIDAYEHNMKLAITLAQPLIITAATVKTHWWWLVFPATGIKVFG
ncbi:hypothetical protein IMY05_015G0035900 [Salix suchowensis]|nr:hypothetical protein IMY05_015G0035900 [Salix suchowensis]